jgi:hypothetical protein
MLTDVPDFFIQTSEALLRIALVVRSCDIDYLPLTICHFSKLCLEAKHIDEASV